MAKKKKGRKKKSVSGYFRNLIGQKPQLLDEPHSNQELLGRWVKDHPTKELTDSIKANLSNLKSVMRAEKSGAKRGGKPSPRPAANKTISRLKEMEGMEKLEESIDDCLVLAKTMDRKGLDHVIEKLRTARNEVVCKIGP